MNGMLKSMFLPNIAAPGEAFSTVWYVEQMTHAASDKKTLMSLAFTNLVVSSSAVRNMFVKTAWIRSSIAFAWAFLTLVGLRFIPYVLHRAWKWSLNLLPLLYIKYWQWGYLLNQVLYTRLLICVDDLSKVVSATIVSSANVTFFPLALGGSSCFGDSW